MQTILVSYDLRNPGRNYQPLWDHLKSYGNWARPLESFWLIKTSSTCEDVWDETVKHIDPNDKLITIDVTGDSAKWRLFDEELTQWIKNNL